MKECVGEMVQGLRLCKGPVFIFFHFGPVTAACVYLQEDQIALASVSTCTLVHRHTSIHITKNKKMYEMKELSNMLEFSILNIINSTQVRIARRDTGSFKGCLEESKKIYESLLLSV